VLGNSASRSFRSGCALLAMAVAALAVSSCGDDAGSDTTMGDMEMEEDFDFGEPAEAADADRVIEMDANSDLTFDPDSITVSEGETVTFRITSTSNLMHDFVLGDAADQDAHEAEMEEMRESGEMMEHSEPNAASVPGDGFVELTWHFTQPGTILFGCHQKGHYDAGMKGTITVESS